MTSFFRVSFLFCLLGMTLTVNVLGMPVDSVDVENIQDPELKEQISQILLDQDRDITMDEEENPRLDRNKALSPSLVRAYSQYSSRLCGVFILCEQGLNGDPEARVFKGYYGRFFPDTIGECKTSTVNEICERQPCVPSFKMSPILDEGFSQKCFYQAKNHECHTGQVVLYKQVSPSGPLSLLFKCRESSDAYTVEFCLCREDAHD